MIILRALALADASVRAATAIAGTIHYLHLSTYVSFEKRICMMFQIFFICVTLGLSTQIGGITIRSNNGQ